MDGGGASGCGRGGGSIAVKLASLACSGGGGVRGAGGRTSVWRCSLSPSFMSFVLT